MEFLATVYRYCTAPKYGTLIEAIRAGDTERVRALASSVAQVQFSSANGTCPLGEAQRLKLNPALIKQIEILDAGFSEEVYLRKELAHRFKISGDSLLHGHTFSLESMYRDQALRMNVASARAFYPMLIQELKRDGPFWKKIRQLSAPYYCHDLRGMIQVLGRIPGLAAQALDHLCMSTFQIEERLKNQGIIAFYHGWPRHIVSGVTDGTSLTRCNRGERPSYVPSGIVTEGITHTHLLSSAIRNLASWTEESFYSGLDALLEPTERNYLPQAEQHVGNCSSIAGYSLEHAALRHLLGWDDAATAFASSIQKMRSVFTKQWTLEKYLAVHGENEAWPADIDLLEQIIYRGKESHIEKIHNWSMASRQDSKLQARISKAIRATLGTEECTDGTSWLEALTARLSFLSNLF